MQKRQVLIMLSVIVLTLASGLVAARPAQESSSGSNQSSEVIVLTGLNRPKLYWTDERIVSAKIPGSIARRLVDDGAQVDVDTVLAVLDDREAKLENERQHLAVSDSLLSGQIAQETLEEYEARAAANSRLIQSRAIPYEEYRLGEVQKRINATKVDQEAKKTEIERSKAAQTKIIFEEHVIRSPIKGRVQKCFKRAMESVTQNDLQMFRIVATDKVWAEGLVPDQYLFRVKEGQRVIIQPVFHDDEGVVVRLRESSEVFEGKVVFIDTDVQPVSHKFMVRAEIENRKEMLRAGLVCEMKIYLDSAN